MNEERFVDLESRLAHQDQLLHELNGVVTQQQSKIMQLEELCGSLVSRMRSISEALPDGDPLSERPPHY